MAFGFKKKKRKQQAAAAAAAGSVQDAAGSSRPAKKHEHATSPSQQRQFKYAPRLSKSQVDIAGLPVNVFGLAELTPVIARSSAAPPPEVCIIFHLHGRTGTADGEERIVRQLYDRIARSRDGERAQPAREWLLVSFDARNHGHRMTHEVGQRGWKEGNERHAMDLYAMYTGTARDVTFLIDFLPAYLFPHDERQVTRWAVTGKSLGGHSVWHVLADDPRITVGCPMIGMPDYNLLLERRTRTSFVPNAPPTVPNSLRALISQIDPAQRDHSSFDATRNPFWGKKICVCSGAADKLVRWDYSERFVRDLVTGEPGPHGMEGVRVVLEENIGHEVTESMIEEAGHWIYNYAVRAGT